MKGSWRLGQIAGIGIFVHWTFLILLAWVAAASFLTGGGWVAAADATVIVLAVFACVVLHELGHAMAARRFGIATADITLLPIGGVARLDRIPEDPGEEVVVAMAGPAVNVAIGLALFASLLLMGEVRQLYGLRLFGAHFLAQLLWINLLLAAFNLLPAFPMDGGRVFRALAARRLSYLRATQIAVAVGQVMALLFVAVGLFFDWWLLLIAAFIYLAGKEELRQVEQRVALKEGRAHDAMLADFCTVDADATMDAVADRIAAGCRWDLPVLDGGRFLGMMRREEVLKAVGAGDWEGHVRDYLDRNCPTAVEDEPLDEVWRRMQADGCPTMAVLRGDELVGLVTSGSIATWRLLHRRSPAGNSVPGSLA